MIDYQRYCQIKDYHENQHLTAAQIARELHLHGRERDVDDEEVEPGHERAEAHDDEGAHDDQDDDDDR